MKYSSGPWSTWNYQNGAIGIANNPANSPAEDIAKVDQDNPAKEANAALIAAAPTMAEAIQVAICILETARSLAEAENALPFLRDAIRSALPDLESETIEATNFLLNNNGKNPEDWE